jgi:hypothetical protein
MKLTDSPRRACGHRPDVAAEEWTAGRDAVVIVNDGFWQWHFGTDPPVVNRAVVLDGGATKSSACCPRA